jgi:hypothetical protein
MALHSLRNQSQLPSKARPGDVFFVTSNPHAPFTYFAVSDGSLICLNDLFSGAAAPVRVVGPAGQPGRDGQSVTGPAGRDGKDGRDGVDGQTITGPRGERGEKGERGIDGRPGKDGRDGVNGKSIVGPKGDKGDRGDVLYVGPDEIKAAAEQMRTERARIRAALWQAIADANGTSPRLRVRLLANIDALRREVGI